MGFYPISYSINYLDMSKVIDIKSQEYPRLLKEIKNSPKQLYYKGDWDTEIFKNCLAVVGSRRMTTYGKHVAERLITKIAAAGITIVSGFMYGIDAVSHRAALTAKGRTIAVMPCGINIIHPAYQEKLYNDILDNNGLIISEFKGDFPPDIWTYPKRNRIVAGLSKAALIIEAGVKSGSLITANYAKEYKRKVFAVPGPITSSNSAGIIQLLKDRALIVSRAGDVLEHYDLKSIDSVANRNSFNLGELEKKILLQLKQEPLEIDVLARIFEVSASKIGTTLSLMQLQGIISKKGNKYYDC